MPDDLTFFPDSQAKHYARLIAAAEYNSTRHPEYGPCDALGESFSCSECNRLFETLTKKDSPRNQEASEAGGVYRKGHCSVASDMSQANTATRQIDDVARCYGFPDDALHRQPTRDERLDAIWEWFVARRERIDVVVAVVEGEKHLRPQRPDPVDNVTSRI